MFVLKSTIEFVILLAEDGDAVLAFVEVDQMQRAGIVTFKQFIPILLIVAK